MRENSKSQNGSLVPAAQNGSFVCFCSWVIGRGLGGPGPTRSLSEKPLFLATAVCCRHGARWLDDETVFVSYTSLQDTSLRPRSGVSWLGRRCHCQQISTLEGPRRPGRRDFALRAEHRRVSRGDEGPRPGEKSSSPGGPQGLRPGEKSSSTGGPQGLRPGEKSSSTGGP